MARKESISRDGLLSAAFTMVKEEGALSVTARKLAAKAACSTQPIFRIFKNMEEMEKELFFMAVAYFEEFCMAYQKKSDVPFVNLGMTYIQFAVENKNVFALIFTSDKRYGKTLYELINGDSGAVSKEIAKAKASGLTNTGDLFMKMWMVIHGSACMSMTGDYDLDEAETKKLLEDSYKKFSK